MGSKKILWLLGGMALSTVIAGCGIRSVLGANSSTNTMAPSYYTNYPFSVPAGAPAPAQLFNGSGAPPPNASVSSTQSSTLPLLPTGGLAGTNGRAAAWAIGLQGALVMFIDPANPLDAQQLHYTDVPIAKKYHVTLDIVDTVPVSHVAPLGPAYFSNPGPSSTVIGQSPSPQTLSQMGATMTKAAKEWDLPSWVHLYVISLQTVAAWQINLRQNPTSWWVVPPGIAPAPALSGLAQNDIGPDNSLASQAFGNPL